MKKSTMLACASVCAFAGFGALLTAGNASAASSTEIYIYKDGSGSSADQSCKIVGSVYSECPENYGSYDAATKTFTMGIGLNSIEGEHIQVSLKDDITIKAAGNIKSNLSISQSGVNANITLDFGNYTFTDELPKNSNRGSYLTADKLTVKSGTYSFLSGLKPNKHFVMDGGTINSYGTIGASEKVVINGGVINIDTTKDPIVAIEAGDGLSAAETSFEMNGGKISAKGAHSGLWSYGNAIIKGGDINFTGVKSGFGIRLDDGKNLTINGGNITIDNFNWGISGNKNNKIYFNGGTTVIKNSIHHTIWLTHAKDPENDIVFGKNMGIKENTYVFWTDDKIDPSTGIADPNTVTIASGYTYRRHYGWEANDGNSVSVQLTAKNVTTNSVVLTAKINTDEETYCDIYRADSEKGEYKKINNSKKLRCDNKKTESYTDKGLKAGKNYFYYAIPADGEYKYEGDYLKVTTKKTDSKTPTTPDTGSFDGGKTIAIVALSVLPATLIGFYVARYIKDRRSHRVKF